VLGGNKDGGAQAALVEHGTKKYQLAVHREGIFSFDAKSNAEKCLKDGDITSRNIPRRPIPSGKF